LILISIDLILTIYYWKLKLSNNFLIFNSLIKIQLYSEKVTSTFSMWRPYSRERCFKTFEEMDGRTKPKSACADAVP
jgi:hypothetical protein